MSTAGKLIRTYTKKDSKTDRNPATGFKKLVFAHKFASAGLTDIDLTALSTPSEMSSLGFVNPSSGSLLGAELRQNRSVLRLFSSTKGELRDYLKYVVISNSLIRLTTITSDLNEIIVGEITPVSVSGFPIVDGRAIVTTGTLGVGITDFVVSEYFEVNKYSSQQVGDVIVMRNGVVQMRNVGNNPSGEGNYYEVAPTSGYLSNTIRFNIAPVSSADNIIVVSNGLVVEKPRAGLSQQVETLQATVDILVEDAALGFGNPTSRYQGQAAVPDLRMFSGRVTAFTTETFYNCVVGSASQYAAGKCTHTTVQAAIDACPTGGKVFVLEGTYSENITINKQITLEGKGRSSLINGTVLLSSGADYCLIKALKFGDNFTFDVGADKSFLRECWLATGKTVTDNGTGNSWSGHVITE